MRKMFKKAVSLAVALTLIIAVLPAMGTAFAAEIGETTQFVIAPRLFNITETGTAGDNTALPTDKSFLFDYLDAGESINTNNATAQSYHRDWKLFLTNWRSDNKTDLTNMDIDASNGMYFHWGSGSGWIAMKVRNFDAGTYNIKIKSDPQRGRVIGLYVLDNATYGNADVATITSAITNMATGVQKVGSADFYGRVGKPAEKLFDSNYGTGHYCINTTLSEAEFGNAVFNSNSEQILVFKDEGPGKLDGKEETSGDDKKFLSIAAISFTPVAPLKNANVFGDKAAFIENTDNGESWLYLVSALDSLVYDEAGFEVSIGGAEATTVKTEDVYSTLIVDGESYFTPEDFGLTSSNYLYLTKTLLTGFTGRTVNFKPYAVQGGETISGSEYQVTLKTN